MATKILKEKKKKPWKYFGQKTRNVYKQQKFFGTIRNMKQKNTKLMNTEDKRGDVTIEEQHIVLRGKEFVMGQ